MPGWIDPHVYGCTSRQYLGHTFRYHLAAGFLQFADVVIDAACGVGYGTAILSERCLSVVGVDIDPEAIRLANASYNHMAQFIEADLCDGHTFFDNFDVGVSFETIEHLRDPGVFLEQLKKARRLIALSAPVIPTKHRSAFHLHDFTEQELLGLVLDDDWILYEKVRQGPYLIVVAYRKGTL